MRVERAYYNAPGLPAQWFLTREEACAGGAAIAEAYAQSVDQDPYYDSHIIGWGLDAQNNCFMDNKRSVWSGGPEGYWIHTYHLWGLFQEQTRQTNSPACYTVKQIDRRGALPNICKSPGKGNPIFPLTGNKREDVDLRIRTGGKSLVLVYDSADAAPMTAGAIRPPAVKPPGAGALWSSTLHRRVVVQLPGKGALVGRGDGRTVHFAGNGSSDTFIADADTNDRLTRVEGVFRYYDASAKTLETFDDKGKLTSIHWATGESVTLGYSASANSLAPAAGYLTHALDTSGRTVTFAYQLPAGADPATGALLSSITDAQGQMLVLGYDSSRNLASLAWADGRTRQFHYENSSFP
ncbi:MAG: hypothetical protein EON92_16455, partial [Burkholderiales bacterium]